MTWSSTPFLTDMDMNAGDQAFVNFAPFLWNRLPYSVGACNTVETFKSHLKTHSFEQYFY